MPHRKKDLEKILKNFFVFEGIDGCGKGTQTLLLKDLLEHHGYEVLATEEPTNGEIGRNIRRVLGEDEGIIRPSMEVLQCEWYTQDRREHQFEIRRALGGAKRVVLCDRYYHSTIAYGAAAKDNVPFDKTWTVNQEFYKPGLTIWLKIPPKDAFRRLNSRKRDLFEKDPDFQMRVHQEYERLAARPEFSEIVTIDASRSVELVALDVQKVVAAHLNPQRAA